MHASGKPGFALPFSLVMAGSILVLAVLVLQQAEFARSISERRRLHRQARETLLAQVQPLGRRLSREVLQDRSTSAIRRIGDGPGNEFLPLLLTDTGEEALLASVASGTDVVNFQSPVSGGRLRAGWIRISPDSLDYALDLAWAAEDVALAAGRNSPPASWPLPSWYLGLRKENAGLDSFLSSAAGADWDQLPWITAGNPLPFSPELSPSLVPVPRRLALHFGIFASGAMGSREKVIRIRYYLSGTLWNPYNRPLALHNGGGLRPVTRMVLRNLPEVRIHNLTRGYSTGWIPLDEVVNDQTGEAGIRGWIRLPGTLRAGDNYAFVEPDPGSQPEGLARTVHPAFQVGPADAVEIEFRSRPGGVDLALVDLDVADPGEAATAGLGWFRLERFPVEFPLLEFPRADEGGQPFYLAGGSLAFRREHCQAALVFARNGLPGVPELDPRRRSVAADAVYPTASGGSLSGTELVAAACLLPSGTSDTDPAAPAMQALFSWPEERPEGLLTASDLPGWREAFRLGAAGAKEHNALLDRSPMPPLRPDSDDFSPEPVPGWKYEERFPVNLVGATAWQALLERSASTDPVTGALRFPAFMQVDPARPEDFRSWSKTRLRLAAEKLAGDIGLDPAKSVTDFFNRGRLATAFASTGPGAAIDQLLPFRGWLRNSPLPGPHGSAWILHLAVRLTRERGSSLIPARAWLLETPEGFSVVRFEWTDPATGLTSPY